MCEHSVRKGRDVTISPVSHSQGIWTNEGEGVEHVKNGSTKFVQSFRRTLL